MSWKKSSQYLLAFSWLFCAFLAEAQTDSTLIDSLKTVLETDTSVLEKKDPFLKRLFDTEGHSPKRAAVYSLILPGAGQAYNKKYWKMPIVYAGLGASAYFLYTNNKDYQRYRTAYLIRVDGDETTIDEFEASGSLLGESDIKFNRDLLQTRREWAGVLLGVVYLLNAADAFVDAHLLTFDVSDDLSMKLRPDIQTQLNGAPAFGLGLRFQFK